MTILEIIALLIKVFFQVYADRKDPEVVKLKAAAIVTEDFHENRDALRTALAENDANVVTAHFADLHDRITELTSDTGTKP